MDRISELSDELLLEILSRLTTQDAVSASVLSNRWKDVWKGAEKASYTCDTLSLMKGDSFCGFLDRNIQKYLDLRSLTLMLNCPSIKPQQIREWIGAALHSRLRELEISYTAHSYLNEILPRTLFQCQSLVTLSLEGDVSLDVLRSRDLCLPRLTTMQLDSLRRLNGETLSRLLSICPILKNLSLSLHRDKRWFQMGLVVVNVPTLQSLWISIPVATSYRIFEEIVIKTPALKVLTLEDFDIVGYHSVSTESMPNLEDAYVDVRYRDISTHIGSITSVKRLTICSVAVHSDGFVFNQLEHLTLCICSGKSSNLLVRFLEDSPNLRVLDILFMDHDGQHYEDHYGDHHLEVSPRTVGVSILSTLQAFNWSRYLERRLAIYILGERWWPKDDNNLV